MPGQPGPCHVKRKCSVWRSGVVVRGSGVGSVSCKLHVPGHCSCPVLLHARESPADSDSPHSGLLSVVGERVAAEGDVSGGVRVGLAKQMPYVERVPSFELFRDRDDLDGLVDPIWA